jgi:hypothetical protein
MNPEIQKVVDLLRSIPHRGEKTVVKDPIDPVKMLPSMYRHMSAVLLKSYF